MRFRFTQCVGFGTACSGMDTLPYSDLAFRCLSGENDLNAVLLSYFVSLVAFSCTLLYSLLHLSAMFCCNIIAALSHPLVQTLFCSSRFAQLCCTLLRSTISLLLSHAPLVLNGREIYIL
jgi:hypothetical protein